MGNITETDHFEKLQEELENTMQEDEKLVFEEQFGDDKDKCKHIRAVKINDISNLKSSVHDMLSYRLSGIINEHYKDIVYDDICAVIDENKNFIKDKCTVCNVDSLYDKTMPIDLRLGYIEGSGQLCLECYDKIYNKGADDEKNDWRYI